MVFGTGIAIITSVYPFSERGKALGIVLTSVYVGLSAGPLLGGLLTDHFGWKSIFCANVIIGVVVIVTTLRKIKGEWAEAKGERFDIIGSLLYIVFFTVAVLGFTSLPSVKGLALLALGTAGLVVFVFWELRIQNPILHIALFMKNRAFLFSNIATLVNYSATFAVTFLISLYLQLVKGFSSQAAGLILVFQPSMQAVLSGLTGRISDRVEPRIISSLGMASLSIGLFILSFLAESTAIYVIVLNLLFLGFGFALFVTPNTNAIMSSVEKKYYGVASGATATMRVIGQTLSMSIVMFVFLYTMGKTHITPENHNEFMLSVRAILLIFACLSFLGVFASLPRKNA